MQTCCEHPPGLHRIIGGEKVCTACETPHPLVMEPTE